MVTLSHAALHKMKVHAMQTYPEECCGLLLGRIEGTTKKVFDLIEISNARQAQRTRRFLIAPEDYARAEQLAKEKAVELVGWYHSHPDHPAKPSMFDLEHALPIWSSVIVSVEQGQPANVTAWLLKDNRSEFEEEEIQVWIDHETFSTNHPCKAIGTST
jgi:proteasome lid subunit RPN8/RPN11